MYKIFFKDRVLVLTANIERDLSQGVGSILKYANQGELRNFIMDFSANSQQARAYIYHHHLNELFTKVKALFRCLPAAGGLVWHADTGAFLGMHRLGHFDLPKGKVEQGESFETAALREVEEECALRVGLLHPLCTTFHTYQLGEDFILKETRWFEMEYQGSDVPQPQSEENIEQVFWVKTEEVKHYLPKTYASIREVLKSSVRLKEL